MAANYPTKMARVLLTTGGATLYTVPAARVGIVTEILLTNITGANASATISIEGVVVVSAATIPPNSTEVIDIKQVIPAGGTITGSAGTANAINAHISGVENF